MTSISAADVRNAYLLILGREPENDTVVAEKMAHFPTLTELRADFLASTEFRRKIGLPDSAQDLLPEQAFNIVYGRAPTLEETSQVTHMASLLNASNARDILRAAVTGFPRYQYPTSVQVRFCSSDLTTAQSRESDFALVLDRADWSVSQTIISTGEYENHLTRFVRLVLRPGMTVVDVGANVGYHTMMFSRFVGETGRIYAFEPNTENCRMVLLSLKQNGINNVKLFPFALSSEVGSVYFSPQIGSNGCFLGDDSETLLDPNCIVIPTLPLDRAIQVDRLDFIKIDVEGAEALVIQGALSLIERYRPIIVAEFSMEMLSRVSGIRGVEHLRRMLDMGYQAFTLGLSGPVQKIENPDEFCANWGDLYRIEDIAFIPREYPFDIGQLR